MNELSEEQKHIIKYVKKGHNVIVDSCAGTGKTTLILSIAKELKRRTLLQMTYNSMLRHEVKERVEHEKIKNMQVHTFHSLAVRYYLPTCYTDTGIRYIILKNLQPIIPIPKFNVLVLDEAQDMTFLYFQFMAKFTKDAGNPIQLLILGDYMQGLYEFKGSDIRFLTFADILWNDFRFLKTQKFELCTMKMSYRITNQMCSFVNNVLLGENRMEACRDGVPVYYIRHSRMNIERIVAAEINKILGEGYYPSDILVLGPSVKGANSNIRHLENILVERNIPCHVPMLENEKVDQRVIDRKVVFSTFHCVKGRQRKFVFITGFDNSYFKFYGRNLSRDKCPNTLYVAATRAMERLYVLESDNYRTDRPLEFMKKSHVEMKQCDYIQFRGNHQTLFPDDDEEDRLRDALMANRHNLTPTEMIKFIPESVIEEISVLLDRVFISEPTNIYELDIPNIIETKQGFFEEVSDLNGIAIPCIYYDYLGEKWLTISISNIVMDMIHATIDNMKPNEHTFLKEIVKELPEKPVSMSDYLYLANVSVAVQETLYFKLKQIEREEYNWLSEGMISQCLKRLDKHIGIDSQEIPKIEDTIIHQSDDKAHAKIDEFLAKHFDTTMKFRFTARVDLITDNTVWELKCTSKITIDHMLQVIIYAWLWKMRVSLDDTKSDEKIFKIYNIKTNELVRLDATMEELNTIIISILKSKFQTQTIKCDDEFIGDCKKYLEQLYELSS